LIRVLVSAKSGITRAGLESVVRADPRLSLVGEGYRDGSLARALREFSPDVVLLDSLEERSLPELMHSPTGPGFVVLVEDVTRKEIRAALQAGVRGILLRESKPEEVTSALQAVAEGLAVISPEILDVLMPINADHAESREMPSGEPLTARESEILALLAEGGGNKEIAARLHISEHTVKFHVSSILAKLGASTRTDAVARGYRDGLIVI
jgi:NarL family two-component system response regulator YdfI